MGRNIFIKEYDKEENIITENLIDFLSNVSSEVFNKFLNLIGIKYKTKSMKDITFSMQQKEKEGIPDATIFNSKHFRIHIESKRVKGTIHELQLERHFNSLKNAIQKEKVLLVITNDSNEPLELKRFKDHHKSNFDTKIIFLNWYMIQNFANESSKFISDKKDQFLINQYLEYLERVGDRLDIKKWAGFTRDIEKKWADYLQWYSNQKKLVNEIKEYLVNKKNWKCSAIKEKDGREIWFAGIKKQSAYFYIGIEYRPEIDGVGFYVYWRLRAPIKKFFSKHPKQFKKMKELLLSKKYKFMTENNHILKMLSFRKILIGKNASGQQKIILNFINEAIKDFEQCGLERLARK